VPANLDRKPRPPRLPRPPTSGPLTIYEPVAQHHAFRKRLEEQVATMHRALQDSSAK
jgi:hypothetical protein